MPTKPELLAPAGGPEALTAAVQNGADAVYLGADNFNARRSADNFAGASLNDAVAYCHERGVRVYVTLNTMVRQDELRELEKTILAIARAGADAVLVSDPGAARAVRIAAPGLALHASTQMAIHNPAGCAFLAEQGFSRVVLAREMSLSEIRACAGLGIELEVFVHGALCVSCSGQCLLSSMIGGRSGNRGRCAQPCRQRYKMGSAEGFLLSTRDLCAIDQLDALREIGVDSFKIEGRLRRPEYVAVVTQAYRRAIDFPDAPRDREPLLQMFNRGGFTDSYLTGLEDEKLMYAERPNHLGVPVGRCIRPGAAALDRNIDARDALVLRASDQDRPVRLSGTAGEIVSCPQARRGEALIRLVSQAQMASAQESCREEHRQIPLRGTLFAHVGQPLRLTVSDGLHTVEAAGEPVSPARTRGASPERFEAQIRKTGGTPYRFESIALDVDPDAFCAMSSLNALRRDALDALARARTAVNARTNTLTIPEPQKTGGPLRSEILVQSCSPALLSRAAAQGADHVIFAPEDLRPAALASAAEELPARFCLAVPIVLEQAELNALNAWAKQLQGRIERTYLGNIGPAALEWPGRKMADAGLNIANTLTLEQLRAWGFDGFTPSAELNAGQIAAMGGAPELILYGRLPLMQLRHCPYRAAHGLKGAHADCRRCDRCAPESHINSLALTDRTGASFPLRRVAKEGGCVIRVLNSVKLMPLKRVRQLPRASGWRLIIDETDDLEDILRIYTLAAGGKDFRSDPAWPPLEAMNTTTGHYFRGAE